MFKALTSSGHYQKLYAQKRLKRIIYEFIFGAVVMYLGCKIYPTSQLDAQPIYLSTAVVFALYSIRGYRITAGLLTGGTIAYYFSPHIHQYDYLSSQILMSVMSAADILFCAFVMRYILDGAHIALVSMRNLKEIMVFIALALVIPQLIFNFDFMPSLNLMITGLGHSIGIIAISSIFLVWDAYVPMFSPAPQEKKINYITHFIWLGMGGLTYLFCEILYNFRFLAVGMSILFFPLALLALIILEKITHRFFYIISLGYVGLAILFYTILNPTLVMQHPYITIQVQLSALVISLFVLWKLVKVP